MKITSEMATELARLQERGWKVEFPASREIRRQIIEKSEKLDPDLSLSSAARHECVEFVRKKMKEGRSDD